jgi:hypothetical protein
LRVVEDHYLGHRNPPKKTTHPPLFRLRSGSWP